MFGSGDSGVEFGLGRTSGSSGLCFTFERDTSAREHECESSSGATIAEVVGVSSVDKTGKMWAGFVSGKRGKIGGEGRERVGSASGEREVGKGFVKVDAPCAGTAEIFGQFLEHGEMEIARRTSKFAESDDSIADIGTARDVSVKEFAKEATIGETIFVDELLMLVGVFRRASGGVKGRNSIKWERGLNLAIFGGLVWRGRGPVMCAQHTVNVACAREDNAIRILGNIDTIEITEETKVAERGFGFAGQLERKAKKTININGEVLRWCGKGEVIDLAEEENGGAIIDAMVDGFIMSG